MSSASARAGSPAIVNAMRSARSIAEEKPPDQPAADAALPSDRAASCSNHKWLVIDAGRADGARYHPGLQQLGSEFMPPLNEGTILYMPITLPGISVTEATKYLQIQDKLLRQFPEVQSVFGKIGQSRDLHRPGAAQHGGNNSRAEAREGMEKGTARPLVLQVGARVREAAAAQDLARARSDQVGRPDR